MDGSDTVAVLVQAGAVGLALVSILGLLYALRLSFNHLHHIGQSLGHIASILRLILDRLEVHK